MSVRVIATLWMIAACTAGVAAGPVKTYPHRMDPRRHPDEVRRAVKPPSYETFGRRMQFMALRDFGNYKVDFERQLVQDRLGDILWPSIGNLFRTNIVEIVQEIKRRGLFLFDPWGFVPGSGKGGPWRQYYVPPETLALFERELGDHWLGMDNGEQDGRYVGGYAPTQIPLGRDRFGQYLNFQRHFERMDRMLGNKMATLVSLAFGHYFLRENCYTMIGAETAQALPNAQIYYSWIRGAGKQYGVPWFGNVSVFNRWGWKGYPQEPSPSCDKGPSPVNGTSLALLKKLMYAQICYNSLACGFENGLYWNGRYVPGGGRELSPIGKIQQGAVDWCARNGDPGVMHAPVAVMTDFYAGWCFPRHLYTGVSYFVWGGLPYDMGDHLTDGVLDLIYPGYCESSYFKDERGFNVDTPYGDMADCILSDAPSWVLGQYAAVILAGRMKPSEELHDTLLAYVRGGGELCLTEGNSRALFPRGFAGLDLGKGRITPIPGGDWGVEEEAQCPLPIVNKPMVPLARPHPLKPEARKVLDDVLRRQVAFATSAEPTTNGLAIISCRRGKGEWTVCVLNNTWQERPLKLYSHVGGILSCEELDTPRDEQVQVGYAPNIYTNLAIGTDSPTTIAAGSVRLFRIRTDEKDEVDDIPETTPVPNVTNAILAIRGEASIKEQVLARPTFFRHYGGVMVDWTYLKRHDLKEIEEERNWIGLQGLRVVVDMSGGFNLFPDLRLVDNDPLETERTEAAIQDVLVKMKAIGAEILIVAPSRRPETNITAIEADASMKGKLAMLARRAAEYGVTVHLRNSPHRLIGSPQQIDGWLADGALKPAVSVAALSLFCERKRNLVEYILRPGEPKYDAIGKAPVYLLGAPGEDENGRLWSLHRPIASQTAIDGAAFESYLRMIKAKGALVIYDALYSDVDEEYRDARLWEGL